MVSHIKHITITHVEGGERGLTRPYSIKIWLSSGTANCLPNPDFSSRILRIQILQQQNLRIQNQQQNPRSQDQQQNFRIQISAAESRIQNQQQTFRIEISAAESRITIQISAAAAESRILRKSRSFFRRPLNTLENYCYDPVCAHKGLGSDLRIFPLLSHHPPMGSWD